jgi:hypothetical protein
VHCLSCGRQHSRQDLQTRLAELNPAAARLAVEIIQHTAANKANKSAQQGPSTQTESQQHTQSQQPQSLNASHSEHSQSALQQPGSTAASPDSTGVSSSGSTGGRSLLQTGSADEVMRSRPSTQPENVSKSNYKGIMTPFSIRVPCCMVQCMPLLKGINVDRRRCETAVEVVVPVRGNV